MHSEMFFYPMNVLFFTALHGMSCADRKIWTTGSNPKVQNSKQTQKRRLKIKNKPLTLIGFKKKRHSKFFLILSLILNKLFGPIPTEIGQLENLKKLSLLKKKILFDSEPDSIHKLLPTASIKADNF